MNMPGSYLVHMFISSVFGPGDVGWRLFDLVSLLILVALIAVYCRPFGKWAVAWSSLFFVAAHLGNGWIAMGQRDFLMCPFLVLGALLLARGLEGSSRKLSLFLSGVSIGCAATVKPDVLILLAFFVILVVWYSRTSLRDCILGSGFLLCGTIIPPVGMFVWLASTGALASFWQIVKEYLPLYAALSGSSAPAPPLVRLVEVFGRRGYMALLPLLALFICTRPAALPRLAVLFGAVLYGIARFIILGKGWGYHLYPLHCFLLMLAGVILCELIVKGQRPVKAAAMTCMLLLALPLCGQCVVTGREKFSLALKRPVVEELVADLSSYSLDSEDTVQILDTSDGGIHALFLLRIRQPTRFIYDFQFFHDLENPYIRSLRSEFIRDLETKPPKLIVVFHHAWLPPGNLDRLKSFPEFTRLLEARYEVNAVRNAYTIYSAK